MSVPGKRRSPLKRARKRVGKTLARAMAAVLPVVYLFYMNLVWRTSRVETIGALAFQASRRRHGGIVGSLWHETVFFVAYAFREFFPSTLASPSDFGQLITNMLHRCRFVVFRGGNRRGKSHRESVLPDMIEHMQRNRDVAYGITVDGSRGPAYVLKPGAVAIGRACGVPLWTVHVAARPALRAPSWDRTLIPLPFGRIVVLFEGERFCPPDADEAAFGRVVAQLQAALIETRDRAEAYVDTGRLPYETDDVRSGPTFFRKGEHVRPVPR